MGALPDRFWTKIETTQDGCWLWTACLDSSGYGKVTWHGRQLGAHRVAYTELIGPVPDGLELDHLCRVRRCVNPAHLQPVTDRENCLRGDGISAKQARRTHCDRGHQMAGDNVEQRGANGRRCRVCRREDAAKPDRAARKKAYMREYYRANRERWGVRSAPAAS